MTKSELYVHCSCTHVHVHVAWYYYVYVQCCTCSHTCTCTCTCIYCIMTMYIICACTAAKHDLKCSYVCMCNAFSLQGNIQVVTLEREEEPLGINLVSYTSKGKWVNGVMSMTVMSPTDIFFSSSSSSSSSSPSPSLYSPPPPISLSHSYPVRDLGVFIAAMDRNGFAARDGQLQVRIYMYMLCAREQLKWSQLECWHACSYTRTPLGIHTCTC